MHIHIQILYIYIAICTNTYKCYTHILHTVVINKEFSIYFHFTLRITSFTSAIISTRPKHIYTVFPRIKSANYPKHGPQHLHSKIIMAIVAPKDKSNSWCIAGVRKIVHRLESNALYFPQAYHASIRVP